MSGGMPQVGGHTTWRDKHPPEKGKMGKSRDSHDQRLRGCSGMEHLGETLLLLYGSSPPGGTSVFSADIESAVAYLEGRLDPAEEQAFRKLLASDPALFEAFSDVILTARGTEYSRVLLTPPADGRTEWSEAISTTWRNWARILVPVCAGFLIVFFLIHHFATLGPLFQSGDAPMTASLGDDVQVALGRDTVFRQTGPSRISLSKGSVWLDVALGGRGFAVDTPYGEVTVTGTSFGVTVGPGNILVEASRGSVVVSQGSVLEVVKAGNTLVSRADGLHLPQLRMAGTHKPDWVQEIMPDPFRQPLVKPYAADSDTALLLHMDELAGERHVIVDSSPNRLDARTQMTGRSADSPLAGVSGPPGLGNAAQITSASTRRVLRESTAQGPSLKEETEALDEMVEFHDSSFHQDRFTVEAWIMSREGVFAGEEPGVFHIQDDLGGTLLPGTPGESHSYFSFALDTARDGQHELFVAYRDPQGNPVRFSSGTPIRFEPGVWYHVAVTYEVQGAGEGGAITFYVDSSATRGAASRPGTVTGRVAGAPRIRPFNGGLDGLYEIGGFACATHSLNGFLDELRYSNTVRGFFNLTD